MVSIIAVEPLTLACADAAIMLELFDSSASWQKIRLFLTEQAACYCSERLTLSFYETPWVRYGNLMETAPELFLRNPHHMLANCLGITKETLRRLRKPLK